MEIESIPTHIKQLLTPDQAWHYQAVPYKEEKGSIFLLTFESSAIYKFTDEIRLLLNTEVQLENTNQSVVEQLLAQYYRKTENVKQELRHDQGDQLTQIVSESKNLGSSDIHIEVYYQQARIRYRIDGKLIEKYVIDKLEYPSLINKIKIRANLDISEKRLPQDGRIKFGSELEGIELRVSVLPTLYGEKIVMRILKSDANHIDLFQIGFAKKQERDIREAIQKPNGIILVSGPTGSGKTTTLYGILKALNIADRNITTIEDPIEYTLEGINQIQVNEAVGLTFSNALRSILRQDPDIIMLGEIRDKETAELAIRASLTGHLVLSTIHTNSAWGILTRMLDMGIPAYLLESTIHLAAAQRLVRKLCNSCKQEHTVEDFPIDFDRYPKLPRYIYRYFVPKGCPICHYTGYKGRNAIFEIIPIENTLRKKIRENETEIDTVLEELSVVSLKENALKLLENGISDIDEIYPILLQN